MNKTIYWTVKQRTNYQTFESKDEAVTEVRYLNAKISESKKGRQTNDKASDRYQWQAKVDAIRAAYGWIN